MRDLSVHETETVSGGFYFTSPLIGAAIGAVLGNGSAQAMALGSGIGAILLTPYCPLHWIYGLTAIATAFGLDNGNNTAHGTETTPAATAAA
ncbi:hypothetical protein [Entomobacter blattae]|uniref:Uncharacterized protein n=1 Tax=Entomobacter blattae TaxID=2762277 RepID=A0A7H1NQB8_9PROT|nr:hypothetical protein [Entomobacter blattae]QNT77978.1 hypothetical protein JGUZn3_07430 [Entomobacter blattae]